MMHIAIHDEIGVDACIPNKSIIKGLFISKTFKLVLHPNNPKYTCHIHKHWSTIVSMMINLLSFLFVNDPY